SVEQQVTLAEQGAAKGKFIGSPIQQWFFANFYQHNKKAAQHFNQSVLLSLKTPIDLAVLSTLAKIIIEHHDVFNSSFKQEDGQWYQVPNEESLSDQQLASFISSGNVNANASHEHQDSRYQNLLIAQQALDIEHGKLIHFRLINE